MPEGIATMKAWDVIAAHQAAAYITIEGNRYLLFQAKNLNATYEKNKKEIGILGRVSRGHKAVGGKGTGKMKIYKNTDIFTDLMLQYIANGKDIYFDLQIINEDVTSAAGRRTTILKDCNLDKVTMAAFDVDGDWLEEDVDFSFESVRVPEKFAMLSGMQA